MITRQKSLPATTIENIRGTYRLEQLSLLVKDEPEKDILCLLGGRRQRNLLRLNRDLSVHYLSQNRQGDWKLMEKGSWSISGNKQICIDGDVGIILYFDGSRLEIVSEDENGFATRIRALYQKLDD